MKRYTEIKLLSLGIWNTTEIDDTKYTFYVWLYAKDILSPRLEVSGT